MATEILEPGELKPELTPEGQEWFGLDGRAGVLHPFLVGLNNDLNSVSGLVMAVGILSKSDERMAEGLKGSVKDFTNTYRRLQLFQNVCGLVNHMFDRVTVGEAAAIIKDTINGVPESKGVLRVQEDSEIPEVNFLLGNFFPTAVQELVRNSVQAGASEVGVNIGLSKDKTQLEIKVVDNGSGIKDLTKLCHLSGSPKMYGSSSRLLSFGTFIATTVVLAHGGTIKFNNRASDASPDQKGAIVTIKLPLLQS